MNKKYSVKDKLTLLLLVTGVLFFGLVLPDSFSDHDKLLHFAAHFGMSFLLALSFYFFCVITLRATKKSSYLVLILATLSIGVIYKLWEIVTQGVFNHFSFSRAIEITGAVTSMSQNLSGMMAAMLLIEGWVDRNLVMSLLRSGHLNIGPVSLPSANSMNRPAEKMQDSPFGAGLPVGSQFSPAQTEN